MIKSTNLTDDFGFDDFLRHHGETAIPLLLIDKNGGLNVFAADRELAPATGDNLIYLVKPERSGPVRGNAAGEKDSSSSSVTRPGT
jgi:hypothetical protein